MPIEQWTEVCNFVQETVTKTIAKKKKCKKAKWLSAEALQIAEKRREAKGKGERERYTQLNTEFQRIARRDKKAFLSEQWKQKPENNCQRGQLSFHLGTRGRYAHIYSLSHTHKDFFGRL